MKSKDIQIGGRYTAMVSGQLCTVRVDALAGRTTGFGTATRYHDAWRCTNLATGRAILVKSAQRFRRVATPGLGPFAPG